MKVSIRQLSGTSQPQTVPLVLASMNEWQVGRGRRPKKGACPERPQERSFRARSVCISARVVVARPPRR